MVAFTFRMPSGISGIISRDQHAVVQPELMLASAPLPAFGISCIRDAASGRVRVAGAGDTSAMIAGFIVKPYPAHGAPNVNDPLGSAVPHVLGIVNLAKRAYMAIVCNGTTAPSKDGPVFLRISSPSAGKPVGGCEAAADGANTIQVPNCVWMGPCDAQGNVEIAYNI